MRSKEAREHALSSGAPHLCLPEVSPVEVVSIHLGPIAVVVVDKGGVQLGHHGMRRSRADATGYGHCRRNDAPPQKTVPHVLASVCCMSRDYGG